MLLLCVAYNAIGAGLRCSCFAQNAACAATVHAPCLLCTHCRWWCVAMLLALHTIPLTLRLPILLALPCTQCHWCCVAMLLLCTECCLLCDFPHDHVVLLCTLCRWCMAAMLLLCTMPRLVLSMATVVDPAVNAMLLVLGCNAPVLNDGDCQ